jgi:sortase A
MKKISNIIAKLLLIGVIIYSFTPLVQDRIIQKNNTEQLIEDFFTIKKKGDIADSILEMQGVLYIPNIDVKLPVYTDTSEHALSRGVGIIKGSGKLTPELNKIPILTSHNGSNTSRLLVNLEKVKQGDFFYSKTEDNIVRKYEVVDIREIEPINELDNMYRPNDGNNYLAIRTCTPINVNTHRLIVTGKEVEFDYMPEPDLVFSQYEIVMFSVGMIALILLIISFVLDYKEARNEVTKKNIDNNIDNNFSSDSND